MWGERRKDIVSALTEFELAFGILGVGLRISSFRIFGVLCFDAWISDFDFGIWILLLIPFERSYAGLVNY